MFDISGASGILAANKHLAAYGAIVLLGGSLAGYAIHEHNTAQKLSVKNAQTAATLNSTEHQLTDLTAKVNMLVAQAQKPSPYPVGEAAPNGEAAPPARPVESRPAAAHHAAAHVRRPDPYIRKLQSQLDAQGKAIEQTRSELEGDLSNTRTELNGSIAHTHDELVALERKGERNYAEFDLNKSKQFERKGPFGIRLRKANTKHQYADLELLVDDRDLTQKHVNLYQPVAFSTPDSPQPIQVVINEISKNHIHGYVSAPKYRQSELAAMANSHDNNAGQDQANAQPALRKRLPVPQVPQ